MAQFKSVRSYWDFHELVGQNARFVRSPKVEEFLSIVRETGQTKVDRLKPEDVLWRAQLGFSWSTDSDPSGNEWPIKVPYPADRMKPLEGRACEGRANPKGIPYLYLATSRDTALAEVRPWVGSLISVGLFKIVRDLKLLDCTSPKVSYRRGFFGDGPPEIREPRVWQDINDAFAKPVTPSDDIADYVPTQIIAELFKAGGFDGIAYRSSLVETEKDKPGNNVVIFDLSAAELVNCRLCELKKIRFEFDQVGSVYPAKSS